MSTPMPSSPFLSASDGLHPLSSVAVAPLAPPALGVTAEIISAASDAAAGTATVSSPAQDLGTAANLSMTMEEPQDAPAAVQSPLNLAETAGASGPLLELHEFLGTGVQAPYPAGPWPADLDPLAFLYAIPDVWSDPSPEFLRDGFIEKPVLIPTVWPELMRERH